jgi:hypothetical protein
MRNNHCEYRNRPAPLPVGQALLAAVILALAVFPQRLPAQLTTTTVQGTIYRADGGPAGGTLLVSWPAFTTPQNQAIAAGSLNTTIGADGFVSMNLTPNAGADPAGSFYTAVYHLSDGTVNTEYWVVPAAGTASIAAIRAQLEPATMAVQAATQAYVNTAVNALAGASLPLAGGVMTGPLTLSADPTSSGQAATKHYADQLSQSNLPANGCSTTTGGNLSCNSVVTQSSVSLLSPWADIRAYQAKIDEVQFRDCTFSAANLSQPTCPAESFTGADVGKNFVVQFIGPDNGTLKTTISSVVSSHVITLAAPASVPTSLSGNIAVTSQGWQASGAYGSDDTAAIQAALNAACGAPQNAGTVYIPSNGRAVLILGQLSIPTNQTNFGSPSCRISGAIAQGLSGSVLDLEYSAGPKILDDNVTLEVDHLSLIDNADGTQPFFKTQGRLYIHDVRFQGLKAAVREVSDGSCSAGSNLLNSASANFTSADQNKPAGVFGALATGGSGQALETWITAVNSSSQVTLADNCQHSVTNALSAVGRYQDIIDLGDNSGNFYASADGSVISNNMFQYYGTGLRFGDSADAVYVVGNYFSGGYGYPPTSATSGTLNTLPPGALPDAPIVLNGLNYGAHANIISGNSFELSNDNPNGASTPVCYQYGVFAINAQDNSFGINDFQDPCFGGGGYTSGATIALYRMDANTRENTFAPSYRGTPGPLSQLSSASTTDVNIPQYGTGDGGATFPYPLKVPVVSWSSLTSDPANPSSGSQWFRSDLGRMSVETSAGVKQLAWTTDAGSKWPVSAVHQTAAIGSSSSPLTIYTPSAAGQYWVTINLLFTNFVAGSSVQAFVSARDDSSSLHGIQTSNLTSASSVNTYGPLQVGAGQPITWYTTYSGTGTYELWITVQQLQ